MSKLDVLIRGGTVVTPGGELVADVGIADGKVAALDWKLASAAREIVDAGGLHIFPGLIDSHVHFNDPGRADWEGIETGSRALAAGGGTLFFDMPLNAHPPTIDVASFDAKLAAARGRSFTDFALWGGLVPGNLDQLEALTGRGVVGFKAFMADSGIEDFARVDDATLRAGMQRAAKLSKIVAVHAESETITRERTRQACAQNRTRIRDYLEARPMQAELEAIERAIEIAGETGCALHIVHVSCGAGVARVVAAQTLGVNVTCETCPHYLMLQEEDMEQLGAVAKCAPPLRDRAEQDKLWQHLLRGEVTTIGSDHSPAAPEMKCDPDFFKVWGGISGGQHTLPLLLTGLGLRGQAKHDPASAAQDESRRAASAPSPPHSAGTVPDALALIAQLTSFNAAKRFNLPATKGRLALGADADFALVDLCQRFTVRPADLFYRHRHSPYVGRALTGRVVQTILRGHTVFRDGRMVSPPRGRLVKLEPIRGQRIK